MEQPPVQLIPFLRRRHELEEHAVRLTRQRPFRQDPHLDGAFERIEIALGGQQVVFAVAVQVQRFLPGAVLKRETGRTGGDPGGTLGVFKIPRRRFRALIVMGEEKDIFRSDFDRFRGREAKRAQ